MRWQAWAKSLVAGGALIYGGPKLVEYVTPTQEELRKRYNPELRRRSEETRDQRLKEHDEFVEKMKEYSKDHRHIWTVWKEAELNEKKKQKAEQRAAVDREQAIREELRKERLGGDGGK